ncbi:hypothetical protein 7S2_17 [uncultured Caudovirales phage]|uniref:Uncharacterized protein n=1 Tax=uncultured Caudovirales phage TaxID=2100421 RepID=A0A2H4J9T9_9CAUD|nr:hypothetical protein 7S2_17 [uncultured Caudovirales phage]
MEHPRPQGASTAAATSLPVWPRINSSTRSRHGPRTTPGGLPAVSDTDTIARIRALANYWLERDGDAKQFGQTLEDVLEGK